jgi:hypothetical protein
MTLVIEIATEKILGQLVNTLPWPLGTGGDRYTYLSASGYQTVDASAVYLEVTR